MTMDARPWAALLLGIVFAGGVAQAGPIVDPIKLDLFTPGAFIVVAELHSPSGTIGDEETSSSLAEVPGAYADLFHGALGFDVMGAPDGSGQVAAADLIVNQAFSGSGDVTIHMMIAGVFDTLGDPVLNGVSFSANIFCTQVYLADRTFNGCPTSAHVQAGDPTPFFGNTDLAFPYDLSVTFPVDATHTEYQFVFNISGNANGSATLGVSHTALISFDLPDGVTMDQTSGFLTTPGEVTLPGDTPSTVPEPSTLATAGLGLLALVFRKAFARRG
ncbi:MAG: PEP-CTERM sorting domain-containing protein [Acidobacteriia bacterium]|nr:PEP-CTERM sorting domain-containing protein [Terriglobia bacterium]